MIWKLNQVVLAKPYRSYSEEHGRIVELTSVQAKVDFGLNGGPQWLNYEVIRPAFCREEKPRQHAYRGNQWGVLEGCETCPRQLTCLARRNT